MILFPHPDFRSGQHVVDKAGPRMAFDETLRDANNRVRLPFVNMLVSVLSSADLPDSPWHLPRLQVPIASNDGV